MGKTSLGAMGILYRINMWAVQSQQDTKIGRVQYSAEILRGCLENSEQPLFLEVYIVSMDV